ncbi:capsular associated protein, glycosyltransferase family 90 protein [Pseudohyphozyma bogoriensis]|nr:capsular associated protein, glycosyltransferase family 90 protein [Pseudohyphozyma bogoriensis]
MSSATNSKLARRRSTFVGHDPDAPPSPSRASFSQGQPPTTSAARRQSAAPSTNPLRFPWSSRVKPPAPTSSVSPKLQQDGTATGEGLWTRALFPGRRPSSVPLPSYGRKLGDKGGVGGPKTRLQWAKEVVIRPFHFVARARRGPLLRALFAVFLLVATYFFYTSSSSSSTTTSPRSYFAVNRGSTSSTSKNPAAAPLIPSPKDKYAPASRAPNSNKPVPTRPDGRILMSEGQRHPIPKLMKEAKMQWEALKARQSKTFKAAVDEYKKRNGRNPPKGFDKWFAFAKAHNVLMIDEFDLINSDLAMYRAFKPPVFRSRVAHLEETFDSIWAINVKDGKVSREGGLAEHDRARGVEQLMKRFVHELPDMRIVYNGHDNARIAVADEERTRLETLVKVGAYDADEQPPFWPKEKGPDPQHSMPIFCPPGSAVREPGFDYGWADPGVTGFEMPPLEGRATGAFIDNFKAYMDVCESPQYRHFHSSTSWVYPHHPTIVAPLFTPGVQPHFGDVHGLITEQLEMEMAHDPTWDERTFTALQWRGQTSGPYWDKFAPWKTSHRARLHLLSHIESGSRNVTITGVNDVTRVVELPNYRLNPTFLDLGMVGPAVQCNKEDGTCDKMYETFGGYEKRLSFDRASLYKYVLDVDGNSWSGRFRRLMMSNAAVVKATIFPEFWTDWAIPWLHFIPMQVDYSDMWDIMAFFRGGLNGEGAHDTLGKEIADAGKEWVRLCYRWPDLEAYQYRLMLEYGRLWNDEVSPGSNDFTGDATIEPEWTGDIKFHAE